jgi:uncharacterized protein YcbK (DUF882 family)
LKPASNQYNALNSGAWPIGTYRNRFLGLLNAIAVCAVFTTQGHAAAPAKPVTPLPKWTAPTPQAGKLSPQPKASSPEPYPNPAFKPTLSGWHERRPEDAVTRDESGRPMLALWSVNTRERVSIASRPSKSWNASETIRPSTTAATATTASAAHASATQSGADGALQFALAELEKASHLLRDPRTGDAFPIDARLLALVYEIQTHFDATEIRIISGYRTPKQFGRSNHGKGRAVDLVVPGVFDEEVAKYVRERGFVGVGVYPTSGFVHVDLRATSYFWVDTSGPGKPRRERSIFGDVAHKSDLFAAQRGVSPIEPFQIASDVDAARAPYLGKAVTQPDPAETKPPAAAGSIPEEED